MSCGRCDPLRARGRPVVLSSEVRRERVLDALDTVFARGGIAGISMTSIAAEAGMSKRTLYELFGDRDALFLAYMDRVQSYYVHELSVGDRELPLAIRLRRLLEPRPKVPNSGLPLAVLRLVIATADTRPDLARVFRSRALISSRDLIRAELERGVGRGEAVIADPDGVAAMLQSMVCIPLIDLLLDPGRRATADDMSARFELGLATFLRGIGVGSAPA